MFILTATHNKGKRAVRSPSPAQRSQPQRRHYAPLSGHDIARLRNAAEAALAEAPASLRRSMGGPVGAHPSKQSAAEWGTYTFALLCAVGDC